MKTSNHLNPRYQQIQDLCMLGYKPGEIAEKLGMSLSWVSTILNAPNFQHQLSIRQAKHIDELDTDIIRTKKEAVDELKENALKAAQKMVNLLDSSKEETILKAASDILDRVGPAKKSGSEGSNNTVIMIDTKMANIIQESLEMDDRNN